LLNSQIGGPVSVRICLETTSSIASRTAVSGGSWLGRAQIGAWRRSIQARVSSATSPSLPST
jgi:hypothetical protein